MWKFRLAALLELRRKTERQRQLELARAISEERRLLDAIVACNATIAQQYAAWGERERLVSVDREATFESRIRSIELQREALQPHLAVAAQAIVNAGTELEAAARARAAIERLETRARTEHAARLLLSEMLALEESNAARAPRRQRERTQ